MEHCQGKKFKLNNRNALSVWGWWIKIILWPMREFCTQMLGVSQCMYLDLRIENG